MNNQKKKEDENRELQKRTESTRGAKVQKLEKREALLGKKSSESNACLVVALVHSLDRLDCDFVLYGTGMLMVVVKLFNDRRRKKSSSSTRSTLCRRKEKILEDLPTASFSVGWLITKKTVRRLASADILECLEERDEASRQTAEQTKKKFSKLTKKGS